MRIGVNLKVDVSKLDKAKFFKGKKGTYVDLTAFIDTENVSDFGDNGRITQKGEKGEQMPIIGNAKIFWRDDANAQPTREHVKEQPQFDKNDLDDDCPF